MKKPLAVEDTVSQGSERVGHFLNHQKRSIKAKPHMKYISGTMPIPPFQAWGEALRTHRESAGTPGDFRESSHL